MGNNLDKSIIDDTLVEILEDYSGIINDIMVDYMDKNELEIAGLIKVVLPYVRYFDYDTIAYYVSRLIEEQEEEKKINKGAQCLGLDEYDFQGVMQELFNRRNVKKRRLGR